MNLTDYIEKESKKNALNQELFAELKKISNDTELLYGVLYLTKNKDDRAALLEYIKKGEDVNYSQIILNALWLYQQRKKESNATDN